MVIKKIGDALREGIALLNKSSIDAAGISARALLCSVLKCDSLYLTVHGSEFLTETQIREYEKLLGRCAEGEPLAYIVKHREFMSLDFYVDQNVLIPRPDTEILCEEIIRRFENRRVVIVDMCTGSGAIAVSLAKYLPHSRVIGLDISSEALKIAEKNSRANGTDARCAFVRHDVMLRFDSALVDCVVSNPPYIPSNDIAALDKNVRDYEPHLALDGGNDGLDFYRAVLKNIRSCLKCGGTLAFEVGCGLHDAVVELMEKDFEDIRILKDLAGIERCVFGTLKDN